VCPQAALTEVHPATRSEINRFQLERDQVWRHGRSILEPEFESLGQRRLPAQKRMLFWGLGQCADSGSIDIDINAHRTSNPGRGSESPTRPIQTWRRREARGEGAAPDNTLLLCGKIRTNVVVAGARNHLQADRSLGFCFEIRI
jgi:hypothetical protein